jgi:hypothetical protein
MFNPNKLDLERGIFIRWPNKDSKRISKHYYSNIINFNLIHWDLNIRAPISRIMDGESFRVYCLLDDCLDSSATPYSALTFLSTEWCATEIRFLFKDNTAGPNGTRISWEEMLELYK